MPTLQQTQQELAQANAELIEQKRLTEQARRIAIALEEEIAACGAKVIFHAPDRLEKLRTAAK